MKKGLLQRKLRKKKDFLFRYSILIFVTFVSLSFIFVDYLTNPFTFIKLFFAMAFVFSYSIICIWCIKYYLKNVNKEIQLCTSLVEKSLKDKENAIKLFESANGPVKVRCINEQVLTKSQRKLIQKYGAELFATITPTHHVNIILRETDGEEIILKTMDISSFVLYYQSIEIA